MQDTQMLLVDRLPMPSTAIVSLDKDFNSSPGDLIVHYRFDRDGSLFDAGIAFSRVRAYRQRAEPYCTSWHIQGYDQVLEITDSSWVLELEAAINTSNARGQVLRHFLLYLDSVGALEVVAGEVALVSETLVASSGERRHENLG